MFIPDINKKIIISLELSRLCVMFVGFIFIVGQLFFGRFDLGSSIAGVFGMLSGITGENTTSPNITKKRKTISYSIISFCGVIIFTFKYFRIEDINFSEYPWFIVLPFCISLGVISMKIAQQGDAN